MRRASLALLASSPPPTIAVSWTIPSDGVVNPVKSHRSERDGVRVKMSGGMPELGSKISLISKADIRYEGRLFTVDPQECTIALANVRSFGTEDRETQLPVAPQNQVYEYILFRGSDIKDIRVVNNVSSIPNDPAIVQMTVQPSMGQQSYQPQPSYAHPMMGQMGPMGGQYGAPYGMGMGAMGPVMGMPTAARDPRGAMNKQPSVLDLISGGSRSTTPTSSLLTRKSPTMDQGIQVGHEQQQQGNNIGKLNDKTNIRTVQPPRRDHDSHGGTKNNAGMSHQYNDTKRDMKQDGQNQGHMQGGRGNRGGWVNRGNMRGRGGRGGRGRGGFRTNQANNLDGIKPKMKFDNDYDFEQANTQFEELRSQLAKTKIDGTDNEKKDDSGNETGAGEGEPEEEPEIVHYDKSKSFFDNISCEAVERSKGRFQRTDWRTERKLNSETFGVASTRRGTFRGRGYYGRGMGGMFRGSGGGNNSGFRGGYRGSRGGNRKPPNQLQNNTGSQNRATNEQSASQSQAKII
ncbi:PREDICTED: protein LSM14 homolog A-like isoform X2 [Trachymyrmex cornetzi]|uniref:protein LSM14 homolog A-like isoform X2 n=1 Tax=Trachymyrmex cornetzi TaxID=471704 RepID=UPI00084EDFB0|nr:PREDICTED: protein LSM14 homolog A-like isoform X2 [Trachymyrmex cornetzi]